MNSVLPCAAIFSGKIGHSERSEESRPRRKENEILRCAQNDGIAYLPENMAVHVLTARLPILVGGIRIMGMQLPWLSLLGIAVGLSMDAFAVSIAAGLAVSRVTPRHVFRVGFHFGLFQFLMPILGWLVGGQLSATIGGCDHWVAFALLAYVGGKMLWEARRKDDTPNPSENKDPTRGLSLLTLSVATSIDALAVGLSMALLGVSVWIPSVAIGVVTACLSALGITFGGRIGSRWGRWAEVAGGIVLILIGVRVLLSHLT